MKYAQKAGLQLVKEFAETETGTHENRDEWVKAVSYCMQSNQKCVIVIEKLDRLARHLMVQERIIEDLDHRNITLLSTREPDLDSKDPTRVFMRQVLGAVAQLDRAMLVLKLRDARRRVKAATGRCDGRKPYGFHPKHPREKKVLKRIQAMRAEGTSYHVISAALNAEGIRPRSGKAWHPSTVQRIVDRAA